MKGIVIRTLVFSAVISLTTQSAGQRGAYFTGTYANLFTELLRKDEVQVRSKVEATFNQLFYGDDSTQRVYYQVGNDMAYIEDVLHNDIRSEGMSYGMMTAVQLDKKIEFDRLWKWTKTYMQHRSGQRKNFLAWQVSTTGTIIDSNSASDGEAWIVTALLFASARWGDGKEIFDYKMEAQNILDAMLSKADSSNQTTVVTNMFNKKEKLIVFVPIGNADDFTDPSYQLPHFYELWARWAPNNNQFWCDAAVASRRFLKKAVHPSTGLAPDYAHFNGSPADPWNGGQKDFRFDAWRVAMNIAVDYSWFGKDRWAVSQSNRLLDFFHSKGVGTYGNLYSLDGKMLSNDHSAGLVAMNAVAALTSTNTNRKDFVEELWNASIPSGPYRYYDGLLYMLGLLQVSGNFRAYEPVHSPIPACADQ